MAQKNRANMLTDIVSNIYNNLVNFITGQNAQDRFVNLLDSSPNILSDKDQADGYVGLGPTSQMFSSYYNENISRSDLITLLAANLAVGFKFYQVNDAVASTRILLVQADSNITLYPIGTDLATGEQGTYDITTDVFLPISGGNASITPITAAALLALQSTSAISTTTLYNVTNAVGSTLVLQVYAIANNTNVVYAIDVATGAIGTYNITTDTFTVAVPDLQQVTTAGATTSVGISVDNGTESIVIKHDLIKIVNALGAEAVILSPTLATTTNFEIPNKLGGTETFAMISDITSLVASVSAGTNISVTGTATNPIINSLADRYKTSSVTSNTIGNGSKTFTVDANLAYIPLQEVLIVNSPSNHMHGEVTSYSGTTLVVDVNHHTGSGTFASWVINLDGIPIDAITGVGTANEIAYFTSGQVIASLAVATYPSLTELSYVKGVTSAIQTQFNALKVEEVNLQDIGTALPASTYTIVLDAKYARTINELTVDAGAGTCTLTMNINGTPVTGISSVSVSTTEATYTATAANAIAIGDTVTIVTTSNSGLANLQITVKTTR
jgi:outer membrane lipoprotein-sorting protein